MARLREIETIFEADADKHAKLRQVLARKNQVTLSRSRIAIFLAFFFFLLSSVFRILLFFSLLLTHVFVSSRQEIAAVVRAIDDIPTRAELIQYERRFVELYQVRRCRRYTFAFPILPPLASHRGSLVCLVCAPLLCAPHS